MGLIWDEARRDRLKELWGKANSRTISAIMTQEGFAVSRNSVIGQANRMGLKKLREPPTPKPPTPRPVKPMPESKSDCRWPIGDPTDAGFSFCTKKALPEKPYCAEHCEKAYRKPGEPE